MGTTERTSIQPRKVETLESKSTVSVALIGTPYVGKTTLFDLLTGLSQRAGNWPGTTVEVRSGTHRRDGRTLEITDLPAVYSLTSNSPDEQVARDFIVKEKPDVVVVMLNATNLERSLYLAAEILELRAPVIVAINMMDVALNSGMRIEAHVLQAALGVPVVPIVAYSGEGVQRLLDVVGDLANGEISYSPKPPILQPELATLRDQLAALLNGGGLFPYPREWSAIKLLEGDKEITQLAEIGLPDEKRGILHTILRENEDAVVSIASARYEWIERMVRAALYKPQHGAVSLTERLDRAATHPILGPALLLGLLALLFWCVYSLAAPVVGLLERAITAAGDALQAALEGAPTWLSGLLVDGVLGGVGTVLSLLPILVVFFVGMGILRHVGYMARAAFVGDRFMHRLGLHGESLIPLFLGFGCNVPAVFGARLIDSARARLLTVLLIPLVPCSGRMVVLVFIAGALFGGSAPFITWALVALNLALLGLTGLLFDRTIPHGERPALIMELPLYHLPNWRAIVVETWQSIKEFLVRAGTVILLVSIVIWFLADQPTGNIQDSYLSQVGRYLEPLGALMGLDWRMMVALLTSFVAKENALASMAILGAGGQESGLASALPLMLTQASALAYLVIQITFIPCSSTVVAILHQTKSWFWTVVVLLYQLALSLVVGILTYQAARLLGWGL
ncbi:MAG: ferrous iron transport protein B [Chloroflexota bacterium]|jgi:ferrous iron transport protein B